MKQQSFFLTVWINIDYQYMYFGYKLQVYKEIL